MPVSRLFAASVLGGLLGTSSLRAQHIISAAADAIPATRFKPTDTLPFGRGVIRGRLDNGLEYYIRRNAKPEQRAELRLVVHAGSLQEDDDQRGLAHMVEHMEFEGSPHFPNRSLVDYLQSIGLRFGADLNAMTTFDYTLYMLRVPTADPAQLAKGFDVLQDWAGGATFDSVALAAQRGIVLEEWRRGQGVETRIQQQTFPIIYKGSRYAVREPIGDPEIITSATRDKLIRFYRDWYRPNLMAVIAVGDFDPAQVEALIKARFAGLTNPAHPRPREVYTIPDNVDPLVAIVADTEVTGAGISVSYKIPPLRKLTAADYRESLVRNIFQSGLAQRYRAMTQVSDPPFLGASAGFGGMTEERGSFSVSVGTRNEGMLPGLNAALAEIERIAQFGLTEPELDRARTSIRTALKNALAEQGDLTSLAYAQEYAESFLAGTPTLDLETEVGLVRQWLPTITNADIKRVAATWRDPQNRIVVAQLPKSLDVLVPDTASLLAAFDYPLRHPLTPHVEVANTEPLLAKPPTPGTIVTRRALPNQIIEWTLSNGIRVLLHPSTNTADQIAIVGTSPGGFNLELDKGDIPASTASQVVGVGGLGNFSMTALERRLNGHTVQLDAKIDAMSEGISATGITNDVETAFQLIYLAATQPRIDTDAVAGFRSEWRAGLENRYASPEAQFQDTIVLTMAQHNPLVHLASVAQADSIDAEKSLEVYRNRFRDMSDFRFIIAGHFIPDSIAPLVERYLASLPGGGRKETPKDLGIRPPTGMVHKIVAAGTAPKATTYLTFYGPMEMTLENEWNLFALVEVIRLRLVARLREELGGTYTPSVQLTAGLTPYPNYSITIGYITSPERDEELARATIAVLDSMQRAPALASDVEAVRQIQLRSLEEATKDEGYWISKIMRYDDLHRSFETIGTDTRIRAWTAADVQRAAKQFLRLDAYARFDLVPAVDGATATQRTPR